MSISAVCQKQEDQKQPLRDLLPRSPIQNVDARIISIGDAIRRSPQPEPRRFVFSEMGHQQRVYYAGAMGLHVTRSTLEMFRMLVRTTASTLIGVELSGILDSRNAIGVQPFVTILAHCIEDYSRSVPMNVLNATQPLRATLNGMLIAPIDDIAYFFPALWVAMRIAFPPVERYLQVREEVLLRLIIEPQGGLPSEVTPSPARPNTTLAKVSLLIDLILPGIFTGVQTALGLRAIANYGSSFILPGSGPEVGSIVAPGFNVTVTSQIQRVVMDSLSGEDPISTDILIALLAVGSLIYAVQAWCNFHSNFQSIQIEEGDKARATPIPEEPLTVPAGEAQGANKPIINLGSPGE